jgi:hypothetical protein
MKNFDQIIHTFGSVFSYGPKLHPTRDWSFLIIVTALIVTLSIGWNAWLFIEAETGKLSASAAALPNHTNAPINVSGVQSVFQKRATEESSYQSAYNFVDPSTQGS